MKKRIGIGLVILLVVALVAIPEGSATGSIKSTFLTKYSLPTSSPLNTCDTCHMPGDTSSWNSYGTALRAQILSGTTASQGMTNIEPLDSDGDGFTNLQEITAVPPTFPGDASSFPPTADTTPPVITMLGSTPIDIDVGTVYVDAGATAFDNKDGDLTSAIVTVNSVNTAVIGSYTVTYNVVDAAGNHAVEKVRTVNVVAAGTDTTPPVITMLGSTPIDILVGSVYIDAGATAFDNKDGDLTSAIVTVNSVNTAVIGSYAVTYNVVDAAGNHAVEKVRTVNVVAESVPVLKTIKVLPSSAHLEVGESQSFWAKTRDQFHHAIKVIVTWASSNTTVGTIDSNGKFTALAEGTTVITATNGTIYGSANVTVSNNANSDDDEHEADDEHEFDDDVHEHENEHHHKIIDSIKKQPNKKTDEKDD